MATYSSEKTLTNTCQQKLRTKTPNKRHLATTKETIFLMKSEMVMFNM